MNLKLYNTLSRTKEVFAPLDWRPEAGVAEADRRVRMYVCGPTAYDFAHIGNARPVIVFDVLFRLLRHLYGAERVKYVRNVTDVDDKINARAAERGVPIRELTEETYRNFKDDVAALGCLEPTVEPRATEHIEEMKLLIERLVASGHAYVAEEHVLFHVPSMPDYGRLSRRPLDEMIAGARVDVAPYKRDPQDFVLWKPSKQEAGSAGGATGTQTTGVPGWPSPCGIATHGRPGWHIECSAMSWKHLGETFDIHGGGIDLVFPHHENEIAQSRCAFHTPLMAQVWMHNGFLQVEGEKMAKSVGNFVTIRELLVDWPGEVLRLNMLKTHYRQPMDWTVKGLEESSRILPEWRRRLLDRSHMSFIEQNRSYYATHQPSSVFFDALTDDLNTPAAIAEIHRLSKTEGIQEAQQCYASIAMLGLTSFEDMQRMQAIEHSDTRTSSVSRSTVEELISARNAARKAKNFAQADRIRDELAALGVVLQDSKDGTTWEVAR